MRAKDDPAAPGIGSGPYGAEPGFTNDDCAPEFGPRNRIPGSVDTLKLANGYAADGHRQQSKAGFKGPQTLSKKTKGI